MLNFLQRKRISFFLSFFLLSFSLVFLLFWDGICLSPCLGIYKGYKALVETQLLTHEPHFLTNISNCPSPPSKPSSLTNIPNPSSPLYEPWEMCDARVKCWMMNSVSEDYLSYVGLAETANKAWKDLRMLFVPCVDLKIYQLRQRIAILRQGGDSLAIYFGKLRRAWKELSEYDPLPECACGDCRCEIKKRAEEAREKEERYAFLMGLNKDLSNVRTHIMLMDPPPSLNEAYGLVDQANRW